MRTLALFPLLLAISPSRIRVRRITEPFQPSFASKNLRSISSGMLLRSSNLEPAPEVFSQRPNVLAGFSPEMLPLIGLGDAAPHLLSGCPPTNTRPPACEIGRPHHSGCCHRLQDIFVTGAFLAYASAGISRCRDILSSARLTCRDHGPRWCSLWRVQVRGGRVKSGRLAAEI